MATEAEAEQSFHRRIAGLLCEEEEEEEEEEEDQAEARLAVLPKGIERNQDKVKHAWLRI